VPQAVRAPVSKYEVLSSNPSANKKRKREKKTRLRLMLEERNFPKAREEIQKHGGRRRGKRKESKMKTEAL
jgi:hypothetical protein